MRKVRQTDKEHDKILDILKMYEKDIAELQIAVKELMDERERVKNN